MKKVIASSGAPKAVGPYSQAIKANGFLFVSGQIPLDPVTGELVYGGIVVQTHQVFANLKAILSAEMLSFKDVVKCTVFLDDIKDFQAVNEVYGEYFAEDMPARSCIQVAKLPRAAGIEIELIAAYPV